MTAERRHVVVVGGGITGLAAAHALAHAPRPPRVTLLEADDRLGGKILTTEIAGHPVDAGPDAFLARVPWATDLCRRLGLGDELVSPARGRAFVWSRGRLRPLPEDLVLGVPTALWPLARSGIVPIPGLVRAGLDLVLPADAPGGDEAIGSLVTRRLGRTVSERLVDPLLGGIYAGDADRLSASMAAPQLVAVARRHRSLILGLRAHRREHPPDPTQPVFHTLPAGLGRLVDRLAAAVEGVDLRLGTRVEAVASDGPGCRLTLDGQAPLGADAVVLATPAHVSSRLLAGAAPAAAGGLAGIEHASVVLVTLAIDAGALPGPLDGSGYLVPRGEGLLHTACSWASSKWAHLAEPGRVLLRVSAGRLGDDRPLRLDEDELLDRLLGELRLVMGLSGEPSAVRVNRWVDAFPQYPPGHLDRVAGIEARVREAIPGVELAGAAYRGIGVPACIRQGEEAAARVLARLEPAPAR